MAGVLKGTQLTEQDAVAEVNITAGGVNAQLDAQGAAFLLSGRQTRC